MKYFLIKKDVTFDTAPIIKNWYGVFDKRNIYRDKSHKLPKREVLFIEENAKTIFTDVICSPLFLVSECVKKVIELYEPKVVFKEAVLLDRENALSNVYYLPILDHIDCLSPESTLTRDRSVIKCSVLDLSKVGESSIFYVSNVGNTYVIARLDIVESILRRGACGFSLEECKISAGGV